MCWPAVSTKYFDNKKKRDVVDDDCRRANKGRAGFKGFVDTRVVQFPGPQLECEVGKTDKADFTDRTHFRRSIIVFVPVMIVLVASTNARKRPVVLDNRLLLVW